MFFRIQLFKNSSNQYYIITAKLHIGKLPLNGSTKQQRKLNFLSTSIQVTTIILTLISLKFLNRHRKIPLYCDKECIASFTLVANLILFSEIKFYFYLKKNKQKSNIKMISIPHCLF